jgi:hypothetical protein
VASVQASFEKTVHQHGPRASDPAHDHHGARSEAGSDQCGSGETPCGTAAAPDDSGCCAMACHVAVATDEYSVPSVDPPRVLKPSILADDFPTELLTRLERPPRRVALGPADLAER